jgi:hypothetical protein
VTLFCLKCPINLKPIEIIAGLIAYFFSYPAHLNCHALIEVIIEVEIWFPERLCVFHGSSLIGVLVRWAEGLFAFTTVDFLFYAEHRGLVGVVVQRFRGG